MQIDTIAASTNNLFPYQTLFVNYFRTTQNQGRFKYQVRIY